MRLATSQLPALDPTDPKPLIELYTQVKAVGADAVLLPELPFSPWFPAHPTYDADVAAQCIADHDAGLQLLADIFPDITVFSTRSGSDGTRLTNTGFSLTQGIVTLHHQKSLLPEEDGWHEQQWFTPGPTDFTAFEINGIRFGFMICTEVMYTEHARQHLKNAVDVIIVPRATGGGLEKWVTAGKMAAIWSGAYVVCANRDADAGSNIPFNGCGYIIDPTGSEVNRTTYDHPFLTVDVDTVFRKQQRDDYPRYLEV